VLGVVARVRSATAGEGQGVSEPVVTELRGGWLAANLGVDFAL
jgi:hypothetical protein